MSLKEPPRLARFLKTLVDILFGLLVFACVGLILWMAVSPVVISQSGGMGTASVPVRIGSGLEPQFEVTFTGTAKDAIHASFVEEAEGTLRLETTSIQLIFIANAAKLLLGIGLAYVFFLLRGILKNILAGEPFAAENGPRIRRLGYTVLLVGILGPLAQYVAAVEILNRLPTTIPDLQPGPTFDAEVILATLLILLLAHIWSYGLELERDKALTV